MALIEKWNAFWKQDAYNPISTNAKNLYMSLLAIFNRSQWKEDKLAISNGTLSGMSSLSEKQIYSARVELVKAGLIVYTSGKKNTAPKYELIDLEAKNDQSGSDLGSHSGVIRESNGSYSESNTEVIRESSGNQSGSHLGEKTAVYKEKEKEIDKYIYNPPISPQGEGCAPKKQEPKKAAPKSDTQKLNAIIASQPEKLREPLREFVRMRTRIKKPLTSHALELNLRELQRLSSGAEAQAEIVEQSIKKGWQGFYPLENKRGPSEPIGSTPQDEIEAIERAFRAEYEC